MAEILPFIAFRYGQKAGDLSKLLSSPYDVLDESKARELSRQSPYNTVRLERPARNDRGYGKLAPFFTDWSSRGILVRDDAPTFTVVEAKFRHRGSERVRTSILVAVKLVSWGEGIYAHEKTRADDRTDRDNVLEHSLLNTSPILGMIADPEMHIQDELDWIRSGHPFVKTAFREVEYAIHVVSPQVFSQKFYEEIKNNAIVIADGHHRYESALQFAQKVEREEVQLPKPNGAGYVMMEIVPLNSPGWVIEPTHRIVHADSHKEYANLLKTITETHDLARLPSADPHSWERSLEKEKGPGVFVLERREEGSARGYLAKPKEPGQFLASLKEQFPKHNEHYRNLDVVTAAYFIERDGVTWEPERDPGQVAAAVRRSPRSLGILGRPPTIQEVYDLARSGETAPPKTTFFLPKALAGFAFRSLKLS